MNRSPRPALFPPQMPHSMEAAGVEPAGHSPRFDALALEADSDLIRTVASMEHCADGWLYFIQEGSDGPIKIGVATYPPRRLASLQTGNPRQLRILAACIGEAGREEHVHRALAACRIGRTEWFLPEPVYDFIENIVRYGVGDALLLRQIATANADREAAA